MWLEPIPTVSPASPEHIQPIPTVQPTSPLHSTAKKTLSSPCHRPTSVYPPRMPKTVTIHTVWSLNHIGQERVGNLSPPYHFHIRKSFILSLNHAMNPYFLNGTSMLSASCMFGSTYCILTGAFARPRVQKTFGLVVCVPGFVVEPGSLWRRKRKP